MSSILIVAGENSGEKYAANLVHRFKNYRPSIDLFGIGGKHMAAQGVNLLYSVEDLSVVGFFELFTHLRRIRNIFRHIKKETILRRPDAAVLVDSPDFNLRLARHLKKLSIPVLYYISPTVWAWRKKRLNTIKKNVKKMLLIFPFEEKIYTEHKIPSVYVGHPLKERVKITLTREEFFGKYGLDLSRKLIILLPGSRKSEIRYHMPVLLRVIEKLSKNADAQFALPVAENITEAYVSSFLEKNAVPIKFLSQDAYEGIAFSDIALSSCGTANLEAALLGTPVVAFYRILPLTYFLGIKLMKIKNFSIVNILAGKKIVPELIQRKFTAENILMETQKILESEEIRCEMKAEYERIRLLLGDKIASENAARELDRLINAERRYQKEET